jgi:RND family efflux transporter MFP subunit
MNRHSSTAWLRPRARLAACAATATLAALTLTACQRATPAEAETPPLSVKTVQPQASVPDALPGFPATLAWDRESVLAFRVGGVVDTLDVRQGQLLERGQLVASLVGTPYEAAATRAHADLERLQRAQKRNETLLPAGAISSSVQEDTDSSASAAQAAARAADYDLSSTRLRAPFRATVLARQAEAGDTVGAGQAVVRVADLDSPLIARVAVPQRHARTLRKGDVARVALEGEAGPLPARIGRIGTLADARTDTVTVDLFLDRVPTASSGAVGSATLGVADRGAAGRTGPDTMTLPAEALLDVRDGKGHVFVLDPRDGTVHRTDIEVLGFNDEFLRVRGLKAGDKVITTGAGFARDGQRVREIAP